MGLRDLTSNAVSAAIAEFDKLGRTEFLRRYGFRRSRTYYVDVGGTLYDSKALAGAAHGHLGRGSRPLLATEFYGGEKTVAATLEKLGFTVRRTAASPKGEDPEERRRNPTWSRDELILALELYLSRPSSPPGPASPEVRVLSALLNRLGSMLGRGHDGLFRNPNGVAMKIQNFRRFDPTFRAAGKVGLSHGNRDEENVWKEYAGDPARLGVVAAAIKAAIEQSRDSLEPLDAELEDDFDDAPEGRLLTVTHFRRERSRKLVEKRKQRAMKLNGRLACEACDFNFAESYGLRGEGFIEVHHTKPLYTLTDDHKTRLEDLALLCSNCHRMIHRMRPWLSVEELRVLLAAV